MKKSGSTAGRCECANFTRFPQQNLALTPVVPYSIPASVILLAGVSWYTSYWWHCRFLLLSFLCHRSWLAPSKLPLSYCRFLPLVQQIASATFLSHCCVEILALPFLAWCYRCNSGCRWCLKLLQRSYELLYVGGTNCNLQLVGVTWPVHSTGHAVYLSWKEIPPLHPMLYFLQLDGNCHQLSTTTHLSSLELGAQKFSFQASKLPS